MLNDLLEKLKKARSVTVLTGAGISKASGIPTYRGKGGMWEHSIPDNLPSQSMFTDNPEAVWEYYKNLRNTMEKAKPNKAHMALAKLEEILGYSFSLITQNIDGLHLKAGSNNVYELHGNIFRCRCIECGTVTRDLHCNGIPKCKKCGGLLRPDVVWFGENLPVETLRKSMKLASSSDVFLVIGTSGVVQPAASLPRIARSSGSWIAEFNIEYSSVSAYADTVILGRCETTLPQLVEGLITW